MKKFVTTAMLMVSVIAFYAFNGNGSVQHRIPASADTLDLKEYAGLYEYLNSPVPSVQIVLRSEKLFAFAEGFSETLLTRQSKDVFTDTVYNAIFSFRRKNGLVDSLIVNANGNELVAVKKK